MKKEILPSILLSVVCMVVLCVIYPVVIWAIALVSDGHGDGQTIKDTNGKEYYRNIAQKFTDDKYFISRPSAVDYNAAGSGGSNKGPFNPDYLADVQKRIDTFLAHNPGITKKEIPSDLVTASGSGLDPHISVEGARVQVKRIAIIRHLQEEQVKKLVNEHIEKPLFGMFGPERVNVLQLNIDLDKLKY